MESPQKAGRLDSDRLCSFRPRGQPRGACTFRTVGICCKNATPSSRIPLIQNISLPLPR